MILDLKCSWKLVRSFIYLIEVFLQSEMTINKWKKLLHPHWFHTVICSTISTQETPFHYFLEIKKKKKISN